MKSGFLRSAVYLGACAAFLLTASNAKGDVLFNTFGGGSSYNVNNGNVLGNAFDGNNYAEAETFTVSGQAVFSGLRLALSCSVAGCPDALTIALTSDSSGSPGSVIESFSYSGTLLGSLGINNVPVSLSSLLNPTLTPGTSYWITVATTLNNSVAWNWNGAGTSALQAISADGGASWFAPSGQTNGVFEVDGSSAPEPTTIATLLGGGALMLLKRKFSRKT
jgi:hypothetical protein